MVRFTARVLPAMLMDRNSKAILREASVKVLPLRKIKTGTVLKAVMWTTVVMAVSWRKTAMETSLHRAPIDVGAEH
jgi:hypothetical protein